MRLQNSDRCIHMDDKWDNCTIYYIHHITKSEIIIAPKLFSEKGKRIIPLGESDKLRVFPFSFLSDNKHRELSVFMERVGNFVCAFLNKFGSLKLTQLNKLLMENEAKFKLEELEIEWILRCLTAAKMIIATYNKEVVSFSISPIFLAIENERKFSAAIAGELEALSQRVRFIINHGPTVGNYRENLLQNSLKKHLPERYHIATGFIYGINRQIDILIYDRVDYAPIFREADLVIVPPESVRAVIEVKTKITPNNLQSALKLLDQISDIDDNHPPFFKGIFAFETSLTEKTLYRKVADFYSDIDAQSQGAPGALICRPFQHLSCICVHNKAFAYIRYNFNKNKRLVPFLHSKRSATELSSQSSFFIQNLLAHLKFGGMKPYKPDYLNRMLGEDTLDTKIQDLREKDDSWGAYFQVENDYEEEDAIEKMETLILSTQEWIHGEGNFENYKDILK